MKQATYIAANGANYEIQEALDGAFSWASGNADHGMFKTVEAAIVSAKKHAEASPKPDMSSPLKAYQSAMAELDRREGELDEILLAVFSHMDEYEAARAILNLHNLTEDEVTAQCLASILRMHNYDPTCEDCKTMIENMLDRRGGQKAA